MDAVPGFNALKPIQVSKHDEEEMGGNGEPLSPMARLFHEPGSNIYIITVIGWKTQIHPDVLKANLLHTLLKHPRFSSLQVLDEENGGEMKWFQTKVDLDNHVIVPDLDPITTDTPDKFVEDYISNLSTTTIDKSKPMWDFHLLNLKTSETDSVGIFRVHHSLGDGTSLISLLLASSHKASDPQASPATTVVKKSNSANSSGIFSVLRLVWNTIVGVVMLMLTAMFFKDTKTPMKGPSGVERNRRWFVRRTVSLDDLKLVKNALNATVNDVVVGVTEAALSTYLNRRYGEGKQADEALVKKNNLPKIIRLRATFFMNLRPAAGIHGGKVRWGNKIGYVLLPFTIALLEDPLAYVHKAKAVMNQKKNSFEATFSYFVTKTIHKFFGSKAVGIFSYRVFSNTTLWFSNVPGPREEILLCGSPVAFIAPSCYGQPNALMIHAVSYVDKMTFMLSADEATIPDPHRLCDDLQHSLNLIKEGSKAGRKQS